MTQDLTRYLSTTAQLESSNDPSARAGTSSATGLYQFIDDTWFNSDPGSPGMMQKYGDQVVPGWRDMPQQQVMDLRLNPEVSRGMMTYFTRDNQNSLRRSLGRDITPAETYMGHFMGATGAKSLIQQADRSPGRLGRDAFPAAARANRPIYYREDAQGRYTIPRTLGEVVQTLNARYEAADALYQGGSVQSDQGSPPQGPGDPIADLLNASSQPSPGELDQSGVNAISAAGLNQNPEQMMMNMDPNTPQVPATGASQPMFLSDQPQQAQATGGAIAPYDPRASYEQSGGVTFNVADGGSPQPTISQDRVAGLIGLRTGAPAQPAPPIQQAQGAPIQQAQGAPIQQASDEMSRRAERMRELRNPNAPSLQPEAPRTGAGAFVSDVAATALTYGNETMFAAAPWIGGAIISMGRLLTGRTPNFLDNVSDQQTAFGALQVQANNSEYLPAGAGTAAAIAGMMTGGGATSGVGVIGREAIRTGNAVMDMVVNAIRGTELSSRTQVGVHALANGALQGGIYAGLSTDARTDMDDLTGVILTDMLLGGALSGAAGYVTAGRERNFFEEAGGQRADQTFLTDAAGKPLNADDTRMLRSSRLFRTLMGGARLLPFANDIVDRAVQMRITRPLDVAFTALGERFGRGIVGTTEVRRARIQAAGQAVYDTMSNSVLSHQRGAFANLMGRNTSMWGDSFARNREMIFKRFYTQRVRGTQISDLPVDPSKVVDATELLARDFTGGVLSDFLGSNEGKRFLNATGRGPESPISGVVPFVFSDMQHIRSIFQDMLVSPGKTEQQRNALEAVISTMNVELERVLPTQRLKDTFNGLLDEWGQLTRVNDAIKGLLGAGPEALISSITGTMNSRTGNIGLLKAVRDIVVQRAPSNQGGALWNDMRTMILGDMALGADGSMNPAALVESYSGMSDAAKGVLFDGVPEVRKQYDNVMRLMKDSMELMSPSDRMNSRGATLLLTLFGSSAGVVAGVAGGAGVIGTGGLMVMGAAGVTWATALATNAGFRRGLSAVLNRTQWLPQTLATSTVRERRNAERQNNNAILSDYRTLLRSTTDPEIKGALRRSMQEFRRSIAGTRLTSE